MSQSTSSAKRRKASSDKPKKLYEDFPLFPHDSGRWAKKILGKFEYFGYWARRENGKLVSAPDDGWHEALDLYNEQKEALYSGRRPRPKGEGLTVRDLVNIFLNVKSRQRDTGEIRNPTFVDYYRTCERIIRVFGKTRLVKDLASDDFEELKADIAKTRGLVSMGNEIQRVRCVFNYAYQADLIDRPVRYGPTFKRPDKKTLRRHRHSMEARCGKKMFTDTEIRDMLDSANPQLKAMVLLGINCGYGNADCGNLPLNAIDFKSKWITFPRPKTAVERRCPLWPETVKAIKEAINSRPAPKDEDDDHLVFITKYGKRWAKEDHDNPITKEMRKLLDTLDIHRNGLGFYALRHTFETIGGDSRDQVAVDYIMGHVDESMAGIYRERVFDDRLRAVTDRIRKWLFRPKKKATKKKGRKN